MEKSEKREEHVVSKDETYTLSEALIMAEIDGELVAAIMDTGSYHSFGEVGSDIVRLLQRGLSVSQIITQLQEEYEIDPHTCQQQVWAFVEDLV